MKKDKNTSEDNISKVLNDPSRVTKIIQSGIQDALLKHKQNGNQICVWRNNKDLWVLLVARNVDWLDAADKPRHIGDRLSHMIYHSD
jgi:hypothetical protein